MAANDSGAEEEFEKLHSKLAQGKIHIEAGENLSLKAIFQKRAPRLVLTLAADFVVGNMEAVQELLLCISLVDPSKTAKNRIEACVVCIPSGILRPNLGELLRYMTAI